MDLKRNVARAVRYGMRFGALRGAAELARVSALSLTSRAEMTVPLPGGGAPIVVRLGTSDLPTFEQVFIERDYLYPLGFEPRAIIDAGANVGYASVWFANAYPNARIVAVEAERSNYELLCRNVAPYPNVTPLHAALWSRETHLAIENPDADKWAFRVVERERAGADTIRGVTVESIARDHGFDEIDLLKIDIEGGEREVFASGYESWLPRVRAMFLELHDHLVPGSSASVNRATSRYHFCQYHRGENVILLRDDRPRREQPGDHHLA